MKPKTLLRKTNEPGNHPYAKKHILQCACGHMFGANGCDVHLGLCPKCEGGAPGLPVDEQTEGEHA